MNTPPPPSTLLVDGHVHIYNQYHWADAVSALVENLTSSIKSTELKQPVTCIGLLAESKDCRFFDEVLVHPLTKGTLQVEVGPDTESLIIRDAGLIKGYLIAGRQLVTLEKLEVLALGKNVSISNGLPLHETLSAITEQGAVPVLSWSPGKWFFGRGKRVHSLIASTTPGRFLIGDIGLRPTLWPLPRLMNMAMRRGFKVMGGSDSLPLTGEERWIGRTGVQMTGSFDPLHPAASLRSILLNPSSSFVPIGERCSLSNFVGRWGRNQLMPK